MSDQTAVQAFDCQQSDDLTIYLCVAVKIDGGLSTVLVVRPFQFTDNPTLSVLPAHSVGTVNGIHIGPPEAGHQPYPMVLITHQPRDRLSAGSDITRILVDPYLASWTALRDMNLPLNVSQILDIAPAANAYGRG